MSAHRFRLFCTARRGVALLLVMIAVMVSSIIAYTYLAAQQTSIGIARNIKNHAKARYIAETGMALTMAYIKSDANWRTNRTVGVWASNVTFGSGSYTVRCDDGIDANGDGIISLPSEGDGNLANNANDPATLTVTGTASTGTYVLRAVLRQGGTSQFGYNTVFSNASGASYDKSQFATQVTLSSDTTVASISAYLTEDKATDTKYAIYADSSGSPGALIAATGSSIAPQATGWFTISFSSAVSLAKGTYWLAIAGNKEMHYYYNTTGGSSKFSGFDPKSGFASPWSGTQSSNAQEISIYATTSGGSKYDVVN